MPLPRPLRQRAGPSCPAAGAGLCSALLLLPLLPGCDGQPSASRPARDLPDVLLVSIDTLRADRLSSYGNDNHTTPAIDRLFAGGLLFERAQAPSAHTAPSHMSLFTGLDPAAHGVHNLLKTDAPVPRVGDRVPLLPERLRAAGYLTAAFTDSGNLMPEMGFDRGFDHQRSRYEGLPKKVKACARWLREQEPDAPLFLFFHTYQVHAPYLPSPRQRGRFTDPDYKGIFRERVDELVGLPPQAVFARAASFLKVREELGSADLEFLSGLYDEGVATADEHLAELWRAWQELRGFENTLIIVVSDHGEALGEHGTLGHGRGLWSEHVDVPLLLRGPGVTPGRVATPISLSGLAPTLLELLDLPALPGQARSFAELVARPDQPGFDAGPVVSQVVGGARLSRQESLLDGELRLLRRESRGAVSDVLFDLGRDPRESADASSERPAEALALGQLLDARWRDSEARFAASGATRGASLVERGADGALRARELEGLGYLGEDSED